MGRDSGAENGHRLRCLDRGTCRSGLASLLDERRLSKFTIKEKRTAQTIVIIFLIPIRVASYVLRLLTLLLLLSSLEHLLEELELCIGTCDEKEGSG